MEDFFQVAPELPDFWASDPLLQNTLRRLLPDKVFEAVSPNLQALGRRCQVQYAPMAERMEQNKPSLLRFDGWGNRVDQIQTCPEWQQMHDVSATEGMVAHGHSKQFGAHSRLHQFARLYLWNSVSGLYSCPLAMTDGAATLLGQILGHTTAGRVLPVAELQPEARDLVQECWSRLTTQDPERFWTSGQWMTERGGGSDVGDGTRTVARLQPDGSYRLYGFKWFTSATDSDMSITLARIEDPGSGTVTPGSQGLSCFVLRMRDVQTGELNGIQIERLKEKLGTRQLPTAELRLEGTRAFLLSQPGRGVSLIASLINITRLYNAITACSGMRLALSLVQDYSRKRAVFGSRLADNPLHTETVAELAVQWQGATAWCFDAVRLLGKVEQGLADQEEQLMLRLLTPLLKLYTGKQAVVVASETLECFGGAGYVEDTGLPRLLRDAQVLPIWEGTTNVLSHDLLRVLTRQPEAIGVLFKWVNARLERHQAVAGPEVLAAVRQAVAQLGTFLKASTSGEGKLALEAFARPLAFALSRVYAASVLLEHAAYTKAAEDRQVLERWVFSDSAPLVPRVLVAAARGKIGVWSREHTEGSRTLAFGLRSRL